MPARREFTPEELGPVGLARLERDRERARLGMRQLRQRRRVTGTAVSVTPIDEGSAVTPTPSPPAPPIPSISKEIDKIGAVLAPFADRGYEHRSAFWLEMRGQFPAVPLLVEAYGMARWLRLPTKKSRTAECSEGFIVNWLKKTARDLAAPPGPRPNGTGNGPFHQPITRQGRNPGPPDLPVLPAPLEVIRPAELEQYRAERSRETLADKVARWKGGAR
jgi:hypothetical protein